LKILLVYPKFPNTFWSFKHILEMMSIKATNPPLGLLTVAAMLPGEWDKRLVDLNVSPLDVRDIGWADYVFVSAMEVQRDSARQIITTCKEMGAKVVAGGPLFSSGYDEFLDVDHLVLNEAEVTLQPFLEDLMKGTPQHVYTSTVKPALINTPVPLWSLIDMKHYASMSIQYTRGCPFDCEFCDIVTLNGREPRTKDTPQILKELDSLYNYGWHGTVFFVDDNFIGNKKKLKSELLPAIIEWQIDHKHPFRLFTEASINLSDDEGLMKLMAETGFNKVFVGIETPNEESLTECNKSVNQNRDLVASVKKMQRNGLEVQGGFIVGFDNDPVSIFENQISFIQSSGIVTAMVGLLNAPRGSRLFKRLQQENRILKGSTGNNTDLSMNFIPKMNQKTLIDGYKHIMDTIYAPPHYYERINVFLGEYRPYHRLGVSQFKPNYIRGFLKSIWILGVKEKGRRYYWRLFIATLLKRPRMFPLSMVLSIYGLHCRRAVESYAGSKASGRV
jgi:radical SAM superfamily enzyme YgiQ (UPF0313 family)